MHLQVQLAAWTVCHDLSFHFELSRSQNSTLVVVNYLYSQSSDCCRSAFVCAPLGSKLLLFRLVYSRFLPRAVHTPLLRAFRKYARPPLRDGVRGTTSSVYMSDGLLLHDG